MFCTIWLSRQRAPSGGKQTELTKGKTKRAKVVEFSSIRKAKLPNVIVEELTTCITTEEVLDRNSTDFDLRTLLNYR